MAVAAHDLPAGHTLTPSDLRSVTRPSNETPPARLASGTGLVLATPLRTGEILTDARVLGPGLLAGQAPGTVAVPVRLGDSAASAIVRAGDRVDVLVSASESSWTSEPDLADGTTGSSGTGSDSTGSGRTTSSSESSTGAERVAIHALVLAVPGGGADAGSLTGADGGSGSSGGSDLATLTGASANQLGASGSGAGVIVLAVSSFEAARLAAAQTGKFVGIAVLPPG